MRKGLKTLQVYRALEGGATDQIAKVEPLDGYRLPNNVDDGTEGVVDVAKLTDLKGVFEPLRDTSKFHEKRVHSGLVTVYWANGADLDPDVLLSLVTGRPINIQTTVR
jgi:hypothetical protein